MKTRVLACGLIVALFVQAAASQERAARARSKSNYPPEFPHAKAEVYKTVGDVKLKLFIFNPEGHKPTDKRPAIVFFFGGGFRGGSPAQFLEQCNYLALRGMVAITADYRVSSRHNTTPADSVQDGKSAMRYVRMNAARLGIDPDRIVASGGSAGGLIAACVGVISDLDKGDEETPVSYTPSAMVLFNPAIMGKSSIRKPDASGRPAFTKEIMAYYHVREGLPPSIMFFGTDDRLLGGAEEFREAALKKGNRCELLTWEGVGHGFFNFNRNNNREFLATLEAADRFLASLGYVKGEPTVDQVIEAAVNPGD